MSSMRTKVLSTFKLLHRTSKKVFKGDEHALKIVRDKINSEFAMKKNVTDIAEIKQCINLALECEHELKTTVIQAVLGDDGKFHAEVHSEFEMFDSSIAYKPMPPEMIGPFKGKKKSCKDKNDDK